MNYDIKITNSDSDDGLIEFGRLSSSNSQTAEQQVHFQIKARSNNTFADLIGKWPGNETVDEIINDLD